MAAIAVVALCGFVAACGGGSGLPEERAESSPEPVVFVDLGSTSGYTYDDGLQVIASTAKRFTTSNAATGVPPGQTGVALTVTIGNGSTAPVSLDGVGVTLIAGVRDPVKADPMFDAGHDIGDGFSGELASGRKATAKFGFAVAPKNYYQLDVAIAPTPERNAAMFSGPAV